MDVISPVRADMATALSAVLPGRVRPYRPDRLAAGATPIVWVDRIDTAPSTFGNTGQAVDVEVTVIVVVDGATHAAQAMRDQLHAAIHDAAVGAGFGWDGATCTTFDLSDAVTALALEVRLSNTVYVSTLCPPEEVTSVPIPPVPVEV